jgi:hypothetical protein
LVAADTIALRKLDIARGENGGGGYRFPIPGKENVSGDHACSGRIVPALIVGGSLAIMVARSNARSKSLTVLIT